MGEKIRILDIHADKVSPGSYTCEGWIRSHRQSKNISFIDLNDGSSLKGLQLIVEPDLESYQPIAQEITTGSSVRVQGNLIESPAKGQKYEFQVAEITLLGTADPETYPLQKKGHTLEFLRENLHLRSRSNTFGAVFRVRSTISHAIHRFFEEQGFYYIHSPIITTSDCEGAGDMFRITTLDLNNIPKKDGEVDFQQDFFKTEAGLSVSGQLEAEALATAIGKVYTFAPTFRSENSNTTRHLSEFWMVEPEMSFCDLQGNMNVAESFLKYIIQDILERCAMDFEFFEQRDWTASDHQKILEQVVNSSFEVLEYSDAISILEKSGRDFEFPVYWGMDMQAEHEKYLTDEHIKGPLFVINYPKEIKPFYMYANEDGKTVRAMDMLVPRLGEIIGGSQREDRYDLLDQKMTEHQLPREDYQWYLDLRKYGTVPHAGFGLGFERFLMYVTGMQNIRDVIPFPRYPGHARIG